MGSERVSGTSVGNGRFAVVPTRQKEVVEGGSRAGYSPH